MSSSTNEGEGDFATDSRRETLRAQFRVVPDTSCTILGSGTRGEGIVRNEVCENGTCSSGCTCRAELTVIEGGEREKRLVEGSVDDGCICPVLKRYDCVADIKSFGENGLLISVTVPSRETLQRVANALREHSRAVELRKVLPLSGKPGDSRLLEINTEAITSKQCEALAMAVEGGYYSTPRKIELADLADELGVTPSAVSQRLKAVESTLASEFVETVADIDECCHPDK